MEVSVVLPCLNEEATVGICIRKAKEVFEKLGIEGEIIVVDNGSTDNSVEAAKRSGAKVVSEERRGYGNAYLRGFREAAGAIIVMADSDATYDLYEMPKFLEALDDADLVIGTRLRGEIKEGAMSWRHRYLGNPLLTKLLNILFRTSISDAHCGMRAFRKEALEKIRPKTAGMEFASEMIIKAAKSGLTIKEVPITYYPRRAGPAKLHSFQDGWRHLRFMLLYKHAMLFLTPGAFLFVTGLFFIILPSPMRYHTMILGSLFTVLGFQTITLGLYSKIYAAIHGIDTADSFTNFFMHYNSLEYGSIIGLLMFLLGGGIGLRILFLWFKSGFAALSEIRNAVLSSTLAILGIQMIFASIFISVLLLERKEENG